MVVLKGMVGDVSPSDKSRSLRPGRRARPPAPTPRLSPDDWADAGLHLIVRRGWPGLTIDNVAAWLRVTKGSFYWHFDDRRSFVKAMLARWRYLSSTATLARVTGVAEPRRRLRRLLELVIEEAGPLELDTAIWAARSDPLVASAIDESSRERIALLADLYRELGHPEPRARRWALSAYSAFVGLLATGTTAREVLRSAADRKAYAQHVIALFAP
jgi:AcrR family transcriptional regulator